MHDKPKYDPRTWFYNHNWHCATIACSLDLVLPFWFEFHHGFVSGGISDSSPKITRFRSDRTPKSKPASFWSCKIQSRTSELHETPRIIVKLLLSSKIHHKTRCNNFWDYVIIFETDVIIFCNKFITRFITSRYDIPRKSGQVKMQELSMGDSSGPPRHPKPSVDAWFCLLRSFWSDFVLRG